MTKEYIAHFAQSRLGLHLDDRELTKVGQWLGKDVRPLMTPASGPVFRTVRAIRKHQEADRLRWAALVTIVVGAIPVIFTPWPWKFAAVPFVYTAIQWWRRAWELEP